MLSADELGILGALDDAVRSETASARIEGIIPRVEEALRRTPAEVLAWEAILLEVYGSMLPEIIRSSWVFILRADAVTGAERHPNSHQRMMSYRGSGDFQTQTEGDWQSHFLSSEPTVPIEERWISILPNVWHQGVVSGEDWVVVSFHTAEEKDLIEERPSD